jgi:hypothetical protein
MRGVNEVGQALSGDAHLATAPSIFDEWLPPGLLIAEIKRVLTDASAISRVVATAQVHPNEFRKVVLAASASTAKLVLHRWLGTDGESSDIHDHRWNFCSRVVSGEIVSDTFAIVRDESGDLVEYSYSSPGMSDRYRLREVAHASVQHTMSSHYRAPDCYVQQFQELHRARDLGNGSLTLIVQGEAMQPKGRVIASPSRLLPGITNVLRPTRDEVIADLSELIDSLECDG